MEADAEGGNELPGLDPELGSRISQLIRLVGSDVEAARVAGVSVDTLANYEKLRTAPKIEPLVRLARKAGVSIGWVVSGEGPMRTDEANRARSAAPDSDDLIALPRYDVAAAAGAGALVVSEDVVDWIYFRREWLRKELGLPASRLAVISATGDSMAPTIESGDLLVLDVGDAAGGLKSDGIYVLGVGDSVVVKRVGVRPTGRISISSDNPLYKHTAEEVERADLRTLHVIGKVVWSGGRV